MLPYKFTVGRYGCSVCGGLPGGMHEPDCAATEELRTAIAGEREACARVVDAEAEDDRRLLGPAFGRRLANIAAAIRAR